MPKQISIEKIVGATISGIIESQKEYEEWTGGYWLWEGPEYLITINVARSITDLEGAKYITLENGASRAIEDAGAKGKGRLHRNIRPNGRVDILLWWADGTPRAIIEIKNQISSKDQYEKDINRIKECLKRNNHKSTLQFGLFCFYESAQNGQRKTAQQKIKDRLRRVKNNAQTLIGTDFNLTLKKSNIYNIDDSAWCGACLLITHKVI